MEFMPKRFMHMRKETPMHSRAAGFLRNGLIHAQYRGKCVACEAEGDSAGQAFFLTRQHVLPRAFATKRGDKLVRKYYSKDAKHRAGDLASDADVYGQLSRLALCGSYVRRLEQAIEGQSVINEDLPSNVILSCHSHNHWMDRGASGFKDRLAKARPDMIVDAYLRTRIDMHAAWKTKFGRREGIRRVPDSRFLALAIRFVEICASIGCWPHEYSGVRVFPVKGTPPIVDDRCMSLLCSLRAEDISDLRTWIANAVIFETQKIFGSGWIRRLESSVSAKASMAELADCLIVEPAMEVSQVFLDCSMQRDILAAELLSRKGSVDLLLAFGGAWQNSYDQVSVFLQTIQRAVNHVPWPYRAFKNPQRGKPFTTSFELAQYLLADLQGVKWQDTVSQLVYDKMFRTFLRQMKAEHLSIYVAFHHDRGVNGLQALTDQSARRRITAAICNATVSKAYSDIRSAFEGFVARAIRIRDATAK